MLAPRIEGSPLFYGDEKSIADSHVPITDDGEGS